MAESEEELKSFLIKVKEESENAGLKLNFQKTKIMASGSIISWQIDGEKMETETDFIFMGSKITLIIIILSIQEHGIFFHLFMSSPTSFISVL